MLYGAAAVAGAIVADAEGDVRVSATGAQGSGIVPGQRVEPGGLVSTAGGARVTLHFDDGMWVALHENSRLRIEGFTFRPQAPAADRAAFELLRGALRVVTGALGHRSPEAFELRAPGVNIGVRGTDFLVAVDNPTYLSVLEGRIVATNAAGRATFGAGDFGVAADGATLAGAVQPRALPPTVASIFRHLGALRLAPPASPDAAARGGAGEDTARGLKDGRNPGRGTEAPGAAARERARGAGPLSK